MERKQIANSVNFISLPNEKFKRNRICITFIVPNDRDKATKFALLPSLMERANKQYPNMQLLSQKLSQMYGASLSASTSVIGCNRYLRFAIQGIKNEYCLQNEDLLQQMCDLLLGIIFEPCVENDGFISQWLEIEKVKLKEEIDSEINDKRGYCIKKAQRKFFGDSLNTVERLGYLDEIDDITSQQLYECYQSIIKDSVVEIFATADNTQEIQQKLKNAFANRDNATNSILPIEIMPKTQLQEYTEKMDIVQGKICLFYTTERLITEKERYVMLVASTVFGGSAANSRLFKNVREKQSLCYYCAAGYNGFTSSLRVDSGVEHQNAQKTIDAIQNELKLLIEQPITEKEIQETKLTLINSLNSVDDALYGLEAWYLNEIVRGADFKTPKDVIKIINTITEQDIKDVLKLFNLNVVYTLTK